MTREMIVRLAGLMIVLLGLVTNFREFQHATVAYQALVDAKINGARLALAGHFVKKNLMLSGVQVFILGGSAFAILVAAGWLSLAWTTAAQLCYMAAVLCLMLIAFANRGDRVTVTDMLAVADSRAADHAAERADDALGRAAVAVVLRDQGVRTAKSADRAYDEANGLNHKIEAVHAEVLKQGAQLAVALEQIRAQGAQLLTALEELRALRERAG